MSERGSAPLELALGALLLLVPAVLIVLSFAPWLERRTLVRSAAAEAARLVVVSDGDEPGAAQRVAEMVSSAGLDPSRVTVSFCDGAAAPASASPSSTCLVDGRLPRGGVVAVEVGMVVPLLTTPFGEVGGVELAHRHVEGVDLYRSVLP